MERSSFALPAWADRDAVDDAIAAAGLRLAGVLPMASDGVQLVALSPDRRTKATFVRRVPIRFEEAVVEGAEVERVGGAIRASLSRSAE